MTNRFWRSVFLPRLQCNGQCRLPWGCIGRWHRRYQAHQTWACARSWKQRWQQCPERHCKQHRWSRSKWSSIFQEQAIAQYQRNHRCLAICHHSCGLGSWKMCKGQEEKSCWRCRKHGFRLSSQSRHQEGIWICTIDISYLVSIQILFVLLNWQQLQ